MKQEFPTQWRIAVATLGVLITTVGCAAPNPARRPVAPDLALATFDFADSIVYHTHFDTSFNGVDWPALRARLRPRAEQARTTGELRDVVREMLRQLGQSHFALIPKEVSEALDPADTSEVAKVGEIGLDVRLLGDDIIVTSVEHDGPAERAGIRPGWSVESIQGETADEIIDAVRNSKSRLDSEFRVWRRTLRRINGETGTTCTVAFFDENRITVEHELIRVATTSEPVRLGNFPTFLSKLSGREITSPQDGVAVGVIRFNVWVLPRLQEVHRLVDSFRGLDGMVIDLRGNGGGMAGMVMGLSGNFFSEDRSLGLFRTRSMDLEMTAMPRRVDSDGARVEPYTGPVAVLIDGGSASASEVFAGGMQSLGRVRVFGETSLGAVLPASMDRLPNGDVLYHAFAEFVTPEGVALEGVGVVPDEEIPLRREDLLAGRDAVLEAAIHWIASERQADAPVIGMLEEEKR